MKNRHALFAGPSWVLVRRTGDLQWRGGNSWFLDGASAVHVGVRVCGVPPHDCPGSSSPSTTVWCSWAGQSLSWAGSHSSGPWWHHPSQEDCFPSLSRWCVKIRLWRSAHWVRRWAWLNNPQVQSWSSIYMKPTPVREWSYVNVNISVLHTDTLLRTIVGPYHKFCCMT